MKIPVPSSPQDICVLPDGSVPKHCSLAEPNVIPPYPPSPVPIASKLDGQWKWLSRQDRSVADFTFRLSVGVQPSKTEPHAPEYFLNKKPWQLFHSSMMPLLFEFSGDVVGTKGKQQQHFDDPILAGPFPIGSVVDFIIHNTLNETATLYKHGAPTWFLGAGEHGPFPYDSVHEAVHNNDDDRDHSTRLNVENPGRNIVHDVPPLGWSVIRFQVTSKEVTMLHSVKLRHFVVSTLHHTLREASHVRVWSHQLTRSIAWYVNADPGGAHTRGFGQCPCICSEQTACRV